MRGGDPDPDRVMSRSKIDVTIAGDLRDCLPELGRVVTVLVFPETKAVNERKTGTKLRVANSPC